jgi:hypothetical protein
MMRGPIAMSERFTGTGQDVQESGTLPHEIRKDWQEPKLEFVEPRLVKQGEMKQLTTQGFIGTFIPDGPEG